MSNTINPKTKFNIVIPSRYGSTRLAAKALCDIHGKTMLQHVYERSQLSAASEVLIATDDERVFACARSFGAKVHMTAMHHPTGTDRISELVQQLNFSDDTVIVNVQGDLPLVPPGAINQVAQLLLDRSELDMSTICQPIHTVEDVLNPHVVKVIFDGNHQAIYFSRHPIPWSEKIIPTHYYKHIGLYAYRVGFLKQYVKWSACELEERESLEQLRAIWYGAKIGVAKSEAAYSPTVDTQEDLEKVRALLSA